MYSAAPTLTMAMLGLIFLVQMSMAVSDKTRQVAVIVPPWDTGGMRLAASLNAPIIDMRWQGHVIFLDLSQDPQAIHRLQDAGFYLFPTNRRSGCTSDGAA